VLIHAARLHAFLCLLLSRNVEKLRCPPDRQRILNVTGFLVIEAAAMEIAKGYLRLDVSQTVDASAFTTDSFEKAIARINATRKGDGSGW
jgi:hypothetical protein